MALSRKLIEAVRSGLRSIQIDIHRVQPDRPPTVAEIAKALPALRDGDSPEHEFLRFCAGRLKGSHSQLLQDLFVLHRTGEKRNGYFVEFGATDGVSLSNTYMLERDYGWSGIVAEPARGWHERLRANRRCRISTLCVWDVSGASLPFNEAPVGELSTIASYSGGDAHAGAREGGRHYAVSTVSLNDLLDMHDAPGEIDYLSIDTEGSELRILAAFDFSRRRIGCISVEHNFTPARRQLHELLTDRGYRRVFESISFWDDWYVLR